MLDIFRGLKNLVKLNNLHTDSPVFRLHYSISVLILIAFSLIVTTRQYVGNPIDCVHTKDIPEDVLNTYCWIHSTYTVKSAFNKKVGVEVAYPGVETTRNEKDKKLYRYYQWVCFCLFFQVSRAINLTMCGYFWPTFKNRLNLTDLIKHVQNIPDLLINGNINNELKRSDCVDVNELFGYVYELRHECNSSKYI